MQKNVAIDKNSREYQENLFKSGRMNLVIVLAFTLVNIVVLLSGGDSYWLFSAAIPYYLTVFGYLFDNGVIGSFTATALVIAGVILAVYLVCWLLSKKHSGWLIAALVLFSLDTAAILILALSSGSVMEFLVDLLFHAYVIVGLARACGAAAKLKTMPAEEVLQPRPPVGPELD